MSDLKLRVTLEAIDKLTAPLRGINRQRQQLVQSYRSDIASYHDTIRKAEKALEGVRETQRKMIAAGNHNTSASIKAEQALMRHIEDTNAALAQRHRLMDKEMDKIRKRQAAMDRGKSMMKYGGIAVASASAATYAGVRFMAPAFEFSEAMSEVQALTQLDKDSEMLKKLRDQADHLGATTWATATQAAQAQAYYAMAGYGPEAILEALPGTLDLAKAAKTELDRTADIISNILTAFNLDPSETEDVADVLTVAFTGANTTLEKLGQTMAYVAPVGEELGLSIEEVAVWAGILGNSGIQDTKAGTAMRKIYTSLAAPNSTALKALDKIGVKTKDAQGNLRNLADVYAEILNKTRKMGSADRIGILSDIVGLEAATAFSIFVDEGNLKDFDLMMEEMDKRRGDFKKELTNTFKNISKEGEKALNDLGVDLLDENKELKEIPDLLNEIVEASKKLEQADQIVLMQKIGGGKLAEAFTAALIESNINDENFIDAIEKNYKTDGITKRTSQIMSDNLISDWVGFQSAITSVQIAIGSINEEPLRKIVQTITKIIQASSAWIKANPKISKTVSSVISGIVILTGALGGLAIIIGIINIVFLANPVSWIILGIVAAIAALTAGVAALVKNKDKVSEFFDEFKKDPAGKIRDFYQGIENVLHSLDSLIEKIPVVGPLLKWTFKIGTAPLRGLVFLIKKLWEGLQWIWDNISEIGDLFASVWKPIGDFLEPIVEAFKSMWAVIKDIAEALRTLELPEWMKGSVDFMTGESADGGIKNSKALDQINMMYMPAQPEANNKNITHNQEINVGGVHVTTNASPQAIGAKVAQAVSSSLIGDEY